MLTLVSFPLTAFTELRPLKTNLQALRCLTARTKKRKTTIKAAAEVLSGGLLRAPAEPRAEAPAGATGVPAAGTMRGQTRCADNGDSPQPQQHCECRETTQRTFPCVTHRWGVNLGSSGTHTITPPCLQCTVSVCSPCYPVPSRKLTAPRKALKRKQEMQKESTDLLHGV